MIGSITPLVRRAHGARRWSQAALAYALGTMLSSTTVGAALGWLGARLAVDPQLAAVAVITIAALLLLAEIGVLPIPTVIWRRQTVKSWRQRGGPARSAFMWGLDIGAGLTTRVTYRSLWGLLALCFIFGSPLLGAIIMASYGAGRIVLVLSGPLLLRARELDAAILAITLPARPWHAVHAWALLAVALITYWNGALIR